MFRVAVKRNAQLVRRNVIFGENFITQQDKDLRRQQNGAAGMPAAFTCYTF